MGPPNALPCQGEALLSPNAVACQVKLRLRRPTVAMAPKPPSREARRIAAKELDMVVPSRFRAAASVLTLSQACSSVLVYMIFAI